MNNDLKPIQTITPFKRFCMTIGELPSSYLETMTYYEMLVWFTKFLQEKVIPTVNNNAEAVKELQDYVSHYFDNLDVQEEINNKLDEMVIDGSLQNLIFNQFENTTQNLFLMACSNKYNSGYANNYIELYMSKNGKEFNKISYNDIVKSVDAPNIIYKNGYFYMLVDNSDTTNASFKILKSSNLIDWTTYKPKLSTPVYNNVIWGAEFFEDLVNDKLYITYSNQIGTMTDDDNIEYRDFRNYIVEIDIENMTLGTQRILQIDDCNRIDPCISFYNNKYYLFVKKEGTEGDLLHGKIAEFESNDLITWNKITDELSPFSSYQYEAPNICKDGNKFILYVDNFDYSNGGGIFYSESYDLVNWTDANKIMTMTDIGHASVIKINDYLPNKTIIDYAFIQISNTKDNLPLFNYNKYYQYKETTATEQNKYIKLFDFTIRRAYEAINIDFNLFDCNNMHYNSKYKLSLKLKSDSTNEGELIEYQSLFNVHIPVYLIKLENYTYSVYLKAIDLNSKPCMQINSLLNNKYIEFKISDYYGYINELPTTDYQLISSFNQNMVYKKYITNVNNIKEPGIYTINAGNTNTPENVYGELFVIDNKEKNWLEQILVSTTKKIYTRTFTSDWSEWKTFTPIKTGSITATTNNTGEIDTNIRISSGYMVSAFCRANKYIISLWSYNNVNYWFHVTNRDGTPVTDTEITVEYCLIEK